MTKEEFQKFMTEFKTCFPMMYSWVEGLDKKEPGLAVRVLTKWRDTMLPLDFKKVMDQLDRWYNTNSQPWEDTTDWQVVPGYFRSAIGTIESERAKAERNQQYTLSNYERPRDMAKMDLTLKEMLQLPREEWDDFVQQKYPVR